MYSYMIFGVSYQTTDPVERIVHLKYNGTPVAVAITELDGKFVTFTSLVAPYHTKVYSVEAIHSRGTTVPHRLALWFNAQHDIEEAA